MTYLHNVCEGKVESVVGFEGCYDDNYGRCMKCGVEGELIVRDTDGVQDVEVVIIRPLTSRHETPTEKTPGLP